MTLVYLMIGFTGLTGAAIAKDSFVKLEAPRLRLLRSRAHRSTELLFTDLPNSCSTDLPLLILAIGFFTGTHQGPFFLPDKLSRADYRSLPKRMTLNANNAFEVWCWVSYYARQLRT